MNRWALLSIAMTTCLIGCSNHTLRGSMESSSDGRTYLVVDDGNGGKCGPIKFDGQVWPHKLGEKGLVTPGKHKIECGGWVVFDIPARVIFRFDYWGP